MSKLVTRTNTEVTESVNYSMAIPIGRLCLPTKQRDPSRSPDIEFSYIDIASVDRTTRSIGDVQRLAGRDAPSRARKEVHAQDVLVSTVRPNLNAVALVCEELDGEIASTGFCVLRPNPAVLHPRYLYYWVTHPEFVGRLTAVMKGANYPAVTDTDVKDALIPWRPLSEQRRIVDLLDAADGLRRKAAAARERAARILPALFMRMFGDPATNPKGWKRATLGDVLVDLRYGTSERSDYDIDGLPVLRIPNIVRGEIDTSDLKYGSLPSNEVDRLRLQHGDLLFVRTNGNPEYVGRCAVFDLSDQYLFASYLIRARLQQDEVDPWFIAALLRTSAGRQAMMPFIRTTAGQSNIGMEGLRQVPIIKPPVPLQARFRERFVQVARIQGSADESAAKLSSLFDVLLHRAFSGELTAKWRAAHAHTLASELAEQARLLGQGQGRLWTEGGAC